MEAAAICRGNSHNRVHVTEYPAPHSAGASAERLHSANRRDGDKRNDQAILDGCRSAIALFEHTKKSSDSDHATLL